MFIKIFNILSGLVGLFVIFVIFIGTLIISYYAIIEYSDKLKRRKHKKLSLFIKMFSPILAIILAVILLIAFDLARIISGP